MKGRIFFIKSKLILCVLPILVLLRKLVHKYYRYRIKLFRFSVFALTIQKWIGQITSTDIIENCFQLNVLKN